MGSCPELRLWGREVAVTFGVVTVSAGDLVGGGSANEVILLEVVMVVEVAEVTGSEGGEEETNKRSRCLEQGLMGNV